MISTENETPELSERRVTEPTSKPVQVKWDKGGDIHKVLVGGFHLVASVDGVWSIVDYRGGCCQCSYDCGRCHMGTAKSRKQARKAAEAKWREVVAVEKVAQAKPEPVPVDAPTRPTVEIVRPERARLFRSSLRHGDVYREAGEHDVAWVLISEQCSAQVYCDGFPTVSFRDPVKHDPEVVRVNLKTEGGRVVGYEDVEPEPVSTKVPAKQVEQGEHFVSDGRICKVTAAAMNAGYSAWIDLESDEIGTVGHLVMVEPCTVVATTRIVATVTA